MLLSKLPAICAHDFHLQHAVAPGHSVEAAPLVVFNDIPYHSPVESTPQSGKKRKKALAWPSVSSPATATRVTIIEGSIILGYGLASREHK